MDIEEEISKLERDERALEKAAEALARLATIAEKWFDRQYPERHVREATLTRVKSPDEREREETIQGSEPTVEQWKDIGPREQAFIDSQKKGKAKDKAPKAAPADKE